MNAVLGTRTGAHLAAELRALEAIFGGRAFGADDVWLSPESAIRHHRSLDERFGPELSEHWQAFGTTGQGDVWLVRRSAPEDVAFLDHDDEGRFSPREMKLSLADWVRLADFFGRLETVARANRDMLDKRHRLRPQHRREVVAALETIAAGLGKRLEDAIDLPHLRVPLHLHGAQLSAEAAALRELRFGPPADEGE